MADAFGEYVSALHGQDFFQQCLRSILGEQKGGDGEILFFLRPLCREIIENAVTFFCQQDLLNFTLQNLCPNSSSLVTCGNAFTVRCRKEGLSLEFLLKIVASIRLQSLQLYSEICFGSVGFARGLLLHCNYFDRLLAECANQWLHAEVSVKQRRLREANQFILQEKRRYRSIFDRMSEPAIIVDQGLRIVDSNKAFDEFFCENKKAYIGQNCSKILGSITCGDSQFRYAMENETSFSDLETELLVNGIKKNVVVGGTFLGEINGEFSGGIIILQDITEKKRYERELRLSEEKYRSLVENVPDVTWREDEKGNIVFVSPNIKQLSGFAVEEMISGGRQFWLGRIFKEDRDTAINEYAGLFVRQENIDVCYRFQRKDSVWVWLRDRTGNLYEQDGVRYVDGVLSDVTKLKLVEQELEEHHLRLAEMVDQRTEELRLANEKLLQEISDRQEAEEELMQLAGRLQESNAELEQFAQVASHDMKEPLVLISAFAERLEKKYVDNLDEKGREYVRRIIASANKLRDLINALLELARVSTKPGQYQIVDLPELLTEIAYQFEEQLRACSGQIIVESPHSIEADRMQIWQLFQNILGNAIKYRKAGIPPRIVIKSSTINDQICEISIEDNGIGFSQKDAERIFIPFERLHPQNNFQGTGMGLATCRKIVARHGGEIMARSAPGEGTTFFVRLPLRRIPGP